jgi:hypothetical protein
MQVSGRIRPSPQVSERPDLINGIKHLRAEWTPNGQVNGG